MLLEENYRTVDLYTRDESYKNKAYAIDGYGCYVVYRYALTSVTMTVNLEWKTYVDGNDKQAMWYYQANNGQGQVAMWLPQPGVDNSWFRSNYPGPQARSRGITLTGPYQTFEFTNVSCDPQFDGHTSVFSYRAKGVSGQQPYPPFPDVLGGISSTETTGFDFLDWYWDCDRWVIGSFSKTWKNLYWSDPFAPFDSKITVTVNE